jgi:hypothetical protein
MVVAMPESPLLWCLAVRCAVALALVSLQPKVKLENACGSSPAPSRGRASAAGRVFLDFRGDPVADGSEFAQLGALVGIAYGIGLLPKQQRLSEPEICVEHIVPPRRHSCSRIVYKLTLPAPGLETKTHDRTWTLSC